MDGISDTKGIRPEKLKHIFWGEVERKRNRFIVKGYHCNQWYGDEKVCISKEPLDPVDPLDPKIPLNRGQRLFEAKVEARKNVTAKKKMSTFYNPAWSRQDVVDCISRVDTLTPREIVCHHLTGHRKLPVLRIDRTTGLVVVDIDNITTYPILR